MKEILHIYCRVSSDVQEQEGTSLDSQQQLGKLKAKQLKFAHKVWNEAAESSNHDEIDKRPQLSALMTAIDDGEVQHLFVTEQSRLARNDNVASMIRYKCKTHDVSLYIRDTVYDFSNPMDTLTVQIMDAFSQFENAIRKERSRLGKIQKVKQGFWHGGPPPYGYELKAYKGGDNKLVIKKDEAKWVKKIFQWYKETSSTKTIQQRLRQEYVRARRGGSFSLGSIQALLKNSHYKGVYVFTDGVSGEEIEVSCPRILDDKLWEDCQSKRQYILQRKGQINRAKQFSLLKSYMWCGHCGTGIGAKIQRSQNREYYYCPKKERQWVKSDNAPKQIEKWKRGRNCGMKRSLNIPATNAVVWDVVTEIAATSHFLKEQIKTEALSSKTTNQQELRERLRNLQKMQKRNMQERNDLENALTKIETDRIMKRISAKQTKEIRQNIQDELSVCLAQLDDIASKMDEAGTQQKWVDWVAQFQKTYANVSHFSEEQQKEYLDGLIDRIEIRYDDDADEHILDIKFQFPIVGDEYVKTKNGYEIKEGQYSAIKQGQMNFKSAGTSVSAKKKRSVLVT